ncbi:hypothetical protein PR202_ga19309 [Eleusine coracana subsp. coracana]|uniref:Uncharacterized protein n=1 Tax=Eleusine coracana subsp. coracana TaxID=191504 RepID=A0AAV5CV93_ELECO|nr:hypothetical protein PR202_ga19309 [Eleusine coracana subsp. coracana]
MLAGARPSPSLPRAPSMQTSPARRRPFLFIPILPQAPSLARELPTARPLASSSLRAYSPPLASSSPRARLPPPVSSRLGARVAAPLHLPPSSVERRRSGSGAALLLWIRVVGVCAGA